MNRVTTSILCVVLFAAGCDSESRDATRKRVEETTGELAERAKELGTRAMQEGAHLLLQGKEASKWTLDELHDLGEQVLREHGKDINQAGALVNELLEEIAQDPSESMTNAQKAGRIVVLMLPFIGPTKRYADARTLYRSGLRNANPEQLQEARRECLIACAEAGLDIGTLGWIGGRADTLATGANGVLTVLKLSRNLNALTGDDLNTFDDFLDQVLAKESVRSGLDAALDASLAKLIPEESR